MHSAIQRAVTIAVLVAAACAPAARTDRPDRNLITAAQIASVRAQSAYDAVQTLHPDWLSTRGPTSVTDPTPTAASVYVNGTQFGDLAVLRTILVADIVEIRYFPAGQASARYGMGHPRGVIEVTTRS
jgi:hypothetical protein